MPRIEFNHLLITKWYVENQEGTSTFDVCLKCRKKIKTAKDFKGASGFGYNGDPIPKDATVVDTGSEPDDIEDMSSVYHCQQCKCELTNKNYYYK